jgi:RNA recognition motif-containing protein
LLQDNLARAPLAERGRSRASEDPDLVRARSKSKVKKIYVGNLPWSATETELKELFSSVGPVQSVAVITDRETGRSRGFGFVEMDDSDAEKAINDLNGRDLGGRALRVNEAQDRQRRPSGGGRW